jgi:hypothetical protein
MAYRSKRRIGVDSRRLVPKRSHLSPSRSHVFLADGNPDEEEIGACGVGTSKHYLGTIHYLPRHLQASTACSR